MHVRAINHVLIAYYSTITVTIKVSDVEQGQRGKHSTAQHSTAQHSSRYIPPRSSAAGRRDGDRRYESILPVGGWYGTGTPIREYDGLKGFEGGVG